MRFNPVQARNAGIRAIQLIAVLIALQACETFSSTELGPAPMPSTYSKDFEEWRQNRHTSLTEPFGWMRLAGMYWLQEGRSSFGSSPSNDLVFPQDKVPGLAGWFILKDGRVWLEAADDVTFLHDGEPTQAIVMFETPLGSEMSGSANGDVAIDYGSLRWSVIKRADRIGVRLYDQENSVADAFTDFDRYPIQQEWYLKAYFSEERRGKTIPITNVLGQVEQVPVAGTLEFEKEGIRYTLVATASGESLFVIVGDPTNRAETYGAGRYLYVDRPSDGGSGLTVIDFNRLYNPPCAFSTFSTCQLPPPGNTLSLSITAGEKKPRPDQIP